jgi:hypothetical protein
MKKLAKRKPEFRLRLPGRQLVGREKVTSRATG